MDIWPNTASLPLRASAAESVVTDPANGLLRGLLRAGRIEAEVVQRLPTELLLNTRLGPLRVPRGLELEVGDRIRIRVDKTGPAPVLRVEREQPQPLRISFNEQPQLARAVLQAPVVLAELITFGRAESQLRLGDRIIQVAGEIPVSRDRLLLLRADRRTAVVEISPVIRRDILLSLLRFMLPQQANKGTGDLVQLFDWALRITQPAQNRPARPQLPPSPDTRIPAQPVPTRSASIPANASASPVPTAPTASNGTAGAVPPRFAVADAESIPPGKPAGKTAPAEVKNTSPQVNNPAPTRTTLVSGNRRPDGPAVDATRGSGAAHHPAILRAPPRPATLAILPGTPVSVAAPSPRTEVAPGSIRTGLPAASRPMSRFAGPNNQPPVSASIDAAVRPAKTPVAPVDFAPSPNQPPAAAAATAETRTPVAPAVTTAGAQVKSWNASGPVSWPDAGPEFGTAQSLAALNGLLRELGHFEATELGRWLQLLGLVRPPAQPATTLIPNDLGALIYRALQPLVDASKPASPAPISGREPVNGEDAPRAESRLPSWLREGLRLVEQALGQTLLQRVATGLQTEAQQPLSLSLTLPFVDQQQVRPLAVEIDQHGDRDGVKDPRWEIRLEFELAGLGPLSCLVSLQAARVGASFFSRSEAVQAEIEAALPELRRQLDRAGLIADELHSHVGEPPSRAQRKPPVPVESVIDLRA